jgi:bifunctional enzyme CysN/CysC
VTVLEQLPQSPRVVWFTGLPGAGKSTVASLVLRGLTRRGVPAYMLDGDDVRKTLSRDLGFADEDRTENVRRVADVARMMAEAGLVVLVALVSPFAEDRGAARALLDQFGFLEVFVDASPDLVAARDPKGLYRQARLGALPHFTGIDSRYEPPKAPDVHLQTDRLTEDEAADCVLRALTSQRTDRTDRTVAALEALI